MIYELAKPEDIQAVYNVVQHTIKTIYPKYYPMEVVDFFCGHHSEDAIETVLCNGELDFVYYHMNQNMQIKTGKCHSVPTVQENGKIELSEKWQWTSGDYSKGESLLVEV